MNKRLVSISIFLMLLISSIPLILDPKPVEASGGHSLTVDNVLNQVHATLGAIAGSAVTVKGTVVNHAAPPPGAGGWLTGVFYKEIGGSGIIPPDLTILWSLDGVTWWPAGPIWCPTWYLGYDLELIIGAGGYYIPIGFNSTTYIKTVINRNINPSDVEVAVFEDLNANGRYDLGEPILSAGNLPVEIDLLIWHTVELDPVIPFFFDTIQTAINAASIGQIIHVYDGTYLEALYINKDLTIRTASTPIIKGSQTFATDFGNREAVIFAENAPSVILENLDVEGDELGPGPTKSYDIIYENSSGIIRGCTISPNTIGDMYSTGIAGWSGSCVTIIDCDFKNFGRIGIYSNAASLVIQNNIIVGQVYSQDNLVNYGVEIEDYSGASTAEISNNEIYNCDNTHPNPLWSSAAIIVDIWRQYYNLPPSTVYVENNYIHNNYEAIEFVSSSLSYAHYNDIYSNRYGIWTDPDLNNNNATFDARFNWWGDSSGPHQATTNPSGLGNDADDYVDYSPWLESVFGTTPRTYHVNPSGAPDAIQEAINEAISGDTILVHYGIYRETLVINKSLTIKAASKPIIEAPDTLITYTFPESGATWNPIIFAYGGTKIGDTVSGSGTISVTLVGFEIDGRNKASSARYIAILYRNVKFGTISNNTIHNMYDSDGQGDGPQTFGILTYGDSNVTIEYNEVRDFSRGGIGVVGDNGALADPLAIVSHNTIAGNGLEVDSGWWAENGIQMGYGAGGIVCDNEVTNCKVNSPNWVSTGILVILSKPNVHILHNLVTDCDTGIAVSSTDLPTYDLIDGNNVTRCTWDAIRVGLDGPASDCTITNNIISNSWTGIGVWDTSTNLIENNTVENNDYGIYISGDSHNNIVIQNLILNNNLDGILVEPYGVDPSGTKVHYNNITGNGVYGVENTGAAIVNATWNWWGDSTGPYHITSWMYMGSPYGPHYGLGDNVSDYILYDLWMTLEQHDISITNVTTSTPHEYPGRIVNITVVIKNNGEVAETLNITVYRDSIPIGSQLTNLNVNETKTLVFSWNTSGLTPCHSWTINAKAPLTGDINPSDNNMTDGTVKIKMIGDLNADGIVDIFDIVEAAAAFGTSPGNSDWNPQAELVQDGIIDVFDLVAISFVFGNTCP